MDKISNIRVVGWTALTIFGILALWLAFQLIGILIFGNFINEALMDVNEADQTLNELNAKVTFVWTTISIGFGLTLLTTISSIGLIKLKNWGLILFHSSSILIIIGLLSGLVYLIIEFRSHSWIDMKIGGSISSFSRFSLIRDGIFILLFAWLLTRANILLGNKIYRTEFK